MKFAIIIPFYNSEQYLRNALDSIINQSLNFAEHTKIILIDDGSTDQSVRISEDYADAYSTIQLIKVKNGGPARARNIALQHVNSDIDIVGFLDADDYFSTSMLQEMSLFFTENPDISIAVPPVTYFGDQQTGHNLNYRFNQGSRVINIEDDYKSIHFYIGGTFFKNKFLPKDKPLFSENMLFFEDALFINQFLLQHKKYGVVANCNYYYRKANNQSLTKSAWSKKRRYTFLLQNGYSPLIELSNTIYGQTIPYIQYLITYHMKLFFFQKNNNLMLEILNKDEQEEFVQVMQSILQIIDEKYIWDVQTKYYIKEFMIAVKNDGWPLKFKEIKPEMDKLIIEKTTLLLKKGRLYIIVLFNCDQYALKKGDYLFLQTKFRKTILTPKIKDKKVKIWGVTVKDYRYSTNISLISLLQLKGQYGLYTTEDGDLLLNKFNLYPQLAQKVKAKIKSLISKKN